MLVKICGIQTIPSGLIAAETGADFIGFVFAKSKRQVTIGEAIAISREMPETIKRVGVFVDLPISEVNEIAHLVNLDYVQLHGNESIDDCQKSDYPVIKALSIQNKGDMDVASQYLPYVDYLLLDGPIAGSGQTFNWELLDDIPLVREMVILAGGLTPENVKKAINKVKPIGVDVSSGVETNGEKDEGKIMNFIQNAKGDN